MSQPGSDDIDVYALLQQANRRGVAENMWRDAPAPLIRSGGRQVGGVPPDDFVNAETRQRLSLPRHEQGGGLISTHIGCELLQQISSFRPERTTSPLIALPVKAYAQWPVEINIFDSQVGRLPALARRCCKAP